MDADKLADFSTIKTALGSSFEAAFCIFFFQDSLLLYNKDFLRCFIIRKSFSGILNFSGIKSSPDVYAFSDKTTNNYKLTSTGL